MIPTGLQHNTTQPAGTAPLTPEAVLAFAKNLSPEQQMKLVQGLAVMPDRSDKAVAQMAQDAAKKLPGHEHEVAQQAALENLAAVTTATRAEVERAFASGKTAQQVTAEYKTADAVTQSLVAETVRETQEGKKLAELAELAESAEIHQEKVGILAEPEQAKAVPNQFAGMVSGELLASIGKAMGGAQRAQDTEVSGPAGGKAAAEQQGRLV